MSKLKAAVERAGYGMRVDEAVLPIKGMTCASCVRRIERALAKLDGVEREVEVSFPVTGMTCASCVRRIERSLSKVEGVHSARRG